MPISVYPPASPNVGQAGVVTKGQVSTGVRGDGVAGNADLDTPDPLGVNTHSFVLVDVTFANASHGGAMFSAFVNGSSGDRFRFQVHPIGMGGTGWVECAAMDVRSGHWDYVHRAYDPISYSSWLVPCPSAGTVRMVREAGTPGAGLCVAAAYASHNAFPFPPKYVGKRDIAMMARSFTVPGTGALALVTYDWLQESDDRTRTLTSGITSRAVTGGKRLWIQGYDAAYVPLGASDRVRVNLIVRANGVVQANNANSPPKFEIGLGSAPGRSVSFPEPLELQNALGSNQMNVGMQAIGNVGGGLLTMTVFGFETL